jgi:hypothetical protein
MIVEVDPQTFMLEVLKYVVVHDCGTVINPLILAGQIHGGVAQGIGNAFYEQLVFDDDGQLLNASLADYLLPTALEVPHMEIAHTVTPSPLNPLGIKGAGEAGAIPVGPLFAQAIEDALGLELVENQRRSSSTKFRSARSTGCSIAVSVGTLDDADAIAQAAQDARAVYHISERQRGELPFARPVSRAGVTRFVFHSASTDRSDATSLGSTRKRRKNGLRGQPVWTVISGKR